MNSGADRTPRYGIGIALRPFGRCDFLKNERRKGGSPMCTPVDLRATLHRGAPIAFIVLLGMGIPAPGPVLAAASATPSDSEESGATYARVRYLEGGLTLERASLGEAVDGGLNSPIA